MKDNARLQTAIEILDAYLPTHGPLAPFIKRSLKERRYAGSSDRRAIAELVFSIIRQAPFLLELLGKDHWEADLGRLLTMAYYDDNKTANLADLFTGTVNEPAPLTPEECACLVQMTTSKAATLGLPLWLYDALKADGTLDDQALQRLQGPAPFDLRCSQPRLEIQEALKAEEIETELTPYSPLGLRVQGIVNLQNHPLFLEGKIDIQDESSQILACLCNPQPGMRILDLCAGAGGKALTLATLCPDSEITATDIDLKRLKIGYDRAEQQKITTIEFVDYKAFLKNASNLEAYDLVLVDAPCSGTGTLRRHPELKLSLTPEKITEHTLLQKNLLETAQKFVAPGGRLVYATCSLLPPENQDVVADFLQEHPFFSPVNVGDLDHNLLQKPTTAQETYLTLTPATHETDGFFAAFFERQ